MYMKNIILGFLVTFAALISGCAKSVKQPELLATQSQKVYTQYKTADYATAKAALQQFINDLNKQVQTDPAQSNSFQIDMMITMVRLAKLEEANGGSEKEHYLAEAVNQCHNLKVKWGDCSIAGLRKRVDEMDQLPPQ